MEIVVIIAIVIAVIGAIAFVARAMEKKRQAELELTAGEMGLDFKPEGDEALRNRLSRYQLFNVGRARKLTNVIQGDTDEVRIAIFDYQYTTGSGKHQHTSKQTIAVLESPELVIPNFSMRSENIFDKIGGALGFQDIDFESHPTFSSMFVLKGDNEPAIRDFFTPEILEFFETKKGISVEANLGGSLMFYRPNTRRKPAELRDLLEQAYQIFGMMIDQKVKK